MKKMIAFILTSLTLTAMAQTQAPKEVVVCFDDIYRNLDLPFDIQYLVHKKGKVLELSIVKNLDEENSRIVLEKKTVQKYTLSDKVVYRDTKNTIRLEIQNEDLMGSGHSKTADVSATNMICLKE